MSQPPTIPDIPPRTCAACGAPLTGRFCASCGAAARTGVCLSCNTPLSPGARFCHRCGAPAAAATGTTGRERLAWGLAGLAVVAAVLAVLWRAGVGRPTVPDMGNAGNIGEAGAGAAGPGQAPDISSMTPEQRFDRLWERVIRAAESGDSVTVVQFSPMALAAYGMLPSVNADQRYHAAAIDLVIGDFASARALADTILAEAPGHLFGYVIRGEAAERQNDAAALTRNYRDFLSHYDAELRSGRSEYAEHQPILDDFRTRAKASLGQ
ncbi:MAG TPA: zinc ribbon domain-containing protein [Gemmatimonadales bacterium]